MATKNLTKKEEFFKVLNLMSTKKVKVRYCRTIKERLRPSVQQESLALPKKPKTSSMSPSTSGKKDTQVEETMIHVNPPTIKLPVDAPLKLRGGVSLLKSMKKRRLRRLKEDSSSSQASVPNSRCLLSYLQHRVQRNLVADDSSSVESEAEDFNPSNFRLKRVTVRMKKMRRERWSLDSNSGDECNVAGFEPSSERGVRSKQAAYRRLIGSLEQELQEEEKLKEEIRREENLVNEVSSENLVMQMVEDFNLESESDDDDEDLIEHSTNVNDLSVSINEDDNDNASVAADTNSYEQIKDEIVPTISNAEIKGSKSSVVLYDKDDGENKVPLKDDGDIVADDVSVTSLLVKDYNLNKDNMETEDDSSERQEKAKEIPVSLKDDGDKAHVVSVVSKEVPVSSNDDGDLAPNDAMPMEETFGSMEDGDKETVVDVDSKEEVPVSSKNEGGSASIDAADMEEEPFDCKDDGDEAPVVLDSNESSVSSKDDLVIASIDTVVMSEESLGSKDDGNEAPTDFVDSKENLVSSKDDRIMALIDTADMDEEPFVYEDDINAAPVVSMDKKKVLVSSKDGGVLSPIDTEVVEERPRSLKDIKDQDIIVTIVTELDRGGSKDNEEKAPVTTVVMEEDPVGVISKDDEDEASADVIRTMAEGQICSQDAEDESLNDTVGKDEIFAVLKDDRAGESVVMDTKEDTVILEKDGEAFFTMDTKSPVILDAVEDEGLTKTVDTEEGPDILKDNEAEASVVMDTDEVPVNFKDDGNETPTATVNVEEAPINNREDDLEAEVFNHEHRSKSPFEASVSLHVPFVNINNDVLKVETHVIDKSVQALAAILVDDCTEASVTDDCNEEKNENEINSKDESVKNPPLTVISALETSVSALEKLEDISDVLSPTTANKEDNATEPPPVSALEDAIEITDITSAQDVESKASFLDNLRLRSVVSELKSTDSVRMMVNRKTLIQYHQILKELDNTSVKTVTRRKKGLKDFLHTEDFGSDELNQLVERMRREGSVRVRSKASLKYPWDEHQRVKVLERFVYYAKACTKEERLKYESRVLVNDENGTIRRLSRPSKDEEEKARNIAGVPSSIYSDFPRGRIPVESHVASCDVAVDVIDEHDDQKNDVLSIEIKDSSKIDIAEQFTVSLVNVEQVDRTDSMVEEDLNSEVVANPEHSKEHATEEVLEEFMEEQVTVIESICVDKLSQPSREEETVADCEKNPVFEVSEDVMEGSLENELKQCGGDISGKRFQCTKCGKELNTKNGLDYHMRTHSGQNPFQCDICFKRFKSSSLCSRHRQIHSVEKKYSCHVCHKSFAQKSNLSKHMDIHAGLKPFQCPVCPKAFTQKVHLECHAMTHTKHKPWKCEHCTTRFSKKSSLIRHCQNVHDLNRIEVENRVEEQDNSKNEDYEGNIEELITVSSKPDDVFCQELNELNIIPVAFEDNSSLLEVQTDLSEANKQFDVEVTYCQDLQNILAVPDDTLFILDTVNSRNVTIEDANVVTEQLTVDTNKNHVSETESEQIEDIEKFLKETKDEEIADENLIGTTQIFPEAKEVRISKDSSYRIPKSPKKPLRTPGQDRKTPHIPFQKEASLRVISVGQNHVQDKIVSSASSSSTKNCLSSPKKHSFEEALNVALTPNSKRPERMKSASKTVKVIDAIPRVPTNKHRAGSSSITTSIASSTASSSSASKPVTKASTAIRDRWKTSQEPALKKVKKESSTSTAVPSQTIVGNTHRQGRVGSKAQCGVVEPYRRQTDLPPVEPYRRILSPTMDRKPFSPTSECKMSRSGQDQRNLPSASEFKLLSPGNKMTSPILGQKILSPTQDYRMMSPTDQISPTSHKFVSYTRDQPNHSSMEEKKIQLTIDNKISSSTIERKMLSPTEKNLSSTSSSSERKSRKMMSPTSSDRRRPIPEIFRHSVGEFSGQSELLPSTSELGSSSYRATPSNSTMVNSSFRANTTTSQQLLLHPYRRCDPAPLESYKLGELANCGEPSSSSSQSHNYRNVSSGQAPYNPNFPSAAPSSGYYTSRAAATGITDIESEEEGMDDEPSPGSCPVSLTLLPTNFPTFDSSPQQQQQPTITTTTTFPSFSPLSSFPLSKPTAVVSPSRPRLPMPLLPKPVPAAIASSPVKVEKVPVIDPGFICRQCPQEFPSRAGLLSHQLASHPWR